MFRVFVGASALMGAAAVCWVIGRMICIIPQVEAFVRDEAMLWGAKSDKRTPVMAYVTAGFFGTRVVAMPAFLCYLIGSGILGR